VAIFYCPIFETPLFVASYDSQGHGGGIRPRLHTGHNLFSTALFFITTLHGPNRNHRFQQYPYCCVFTDPLLKNGFFYCCVHIRCRGNVFAEPLSSNEHPLRLQYSGLQASCHNIFEFIEQICIKRKHTKEIASVWPYVLSPKLVIIGFKRNSIFKI
jgi:hypothetical protein